MVTIQAVLRGEGLSERDGLFANLRSAVPAGESRTGAGKSPALPVLKTRFQTVETDRRLPTAQSRRVRAPMNHVFRRLPVTSALTLLALGAAAQNARLKPLAQQRGGC